MKVLLNLKRICHPVPLLLGLALNSVAVAGDGEPAARPPVAQRSAITKTAEVDQNQGELERRPVANGGADRRAALGVFLAQSEKAVTVTGVISGSPAHHAGLNVGDQVVYVGDQQVGTVGNLTDLIGTSLPGAPLELIVLRGGHAQIIKVQLANCDSLFNGQTTPSKSVSVRPGSSSIRVSHTTARPSGPGQTPNTARPCVPASTSRLAAEQPPVARLGALVQRIDSLQREIDELRSSGRAVPLKTFDARGWWERQHRGEADNDPALFQ
jgi:hypothetical protein